MAYTTSGISNIRFEQTDLSVTVRATTSHTDKLIQCYVSGELKAWQKPEEGAVSFQVNRPGNVDLIFLLAVDEDEGHVDYWDDAFPGAAANGHRIKVSVPQLNQSFNPGDVLVIYRGAAGAASADVERHRQAYYPGGRPGVGFGFNFGYGGFGYDGYGMRGFGYNFGYGEFGFDCDMLTWESEPLPPGVYPIKVVIEDQYGNESTAYETTQTLASYAQPAESLAVDSYVKGTDTLTLSFTESPDV